MSRPAQNTRRRPERKPLWLPRAAGSRENASRDQFQRFMAQCVLLCTGINAAFVVGMTEAGIFIVPVHHEVLVTVQGILCIVFLVAIRRHAGYLTLAIQFYVASILVVCLSTDLMQAGRNRFVVAV